MKNIILIIALTVFAITANAQNKPKSTYTVGKSKVTVWENKKKGKYGEYTEKNFKIEKVYKKDDKWESTNYFNTEELLQLRAAIDKAINKEVVEVNDEKTE